MDPTEDTLPEEDARLSVDALMGLRSLLDWRQELLEKLLAYEGMCLLLFVCSRIAEGGPCETSRAHHKRAGCIYSTDAQLMS